MHDKEQAYRQAYHEQVRGRKTRDPGDTYTVDEVGPLTRAYGCGPAFLTYADLGGLAGAELDALIAGQREFFQGIGNPVEWKYYDYDEPADLPERLVAAGFVPEEVEAILVGEAADLVGDVPLPDGIRLREVTEPADFERIKRLEDTVWGHDHTWLLDRLLQSIVNVVAEDERGEVVSAGWLRATHGTEFAGLWGGSTLEPWRGKGLYRALVAHRARVAVERGFRYLHVDASPDSAPILRRLGLVQIATSTPYVFTPA